MRVIIATCAGVIVLAVTAWTILASRLFVLIGGLSAAFPSPWTTWWRYARHPVVGRTTLVYLTVSGIIAAVVVLLLGTLIGLAVRRTLIMAAPIYGRTGWATPQQMTEGGLRLRKRL